MSARFRRLAVLGLGLLGGSVARAARARGVADEVVGATRRRDVLRDALACGAIDRAAPPEEAVEGADLVVLATPVFAMGATVERVAPRLAPDALVTDVGSVKGALAETLPGLLPRGVRYVGSHPMAGSHETGFAHARADLFEGAACIVTGEPGDAAADAVAGFWSDLGARVVRRDAAGHDAEVAWTSHVPHVLAFAFGAALQRAPAGAAEVAGSGFRDFTRIARSDAELWSDILTANRKAVAAPLQAVADVLTELSRAVESGDGETVERIIAAARAALSGPYAAASGGDVRPREASHTNPQPAASPSGGARSDDNQHE